MNFFWGARNRREQREQTITSEDAAQKSEITIADIIKARKEKDYLGAWVLLKEHHRRLQQHRRQTREAAR